MEEKTKEYLEFIKSRRSIREFVFKKIPQEIIKEILECGRWAPSGLNNQPWKVYAVAQPTVKRLVSEQTKYQEIIENSFVSLVIFLDIEKGYNRVKDIQACGAFMQNILLAVHAFPNLGAVWLGEIINQKQAFQKSYSIDKNNELMAVIALGYPSESPESPGRRPVDSFILEEINNLSSQD